MYENYQQKLLNIIDGMRRENGTYIAAPSEDYKNWTWIRDGFYINLSNLYHDFGKYTQMCHTYFDFLKKYEYDYGNKLTWLAKNKDFHSNIENMRHFVHPRVHPDGSENDQNWAFNQGDTLAYYILTIWYAYREIGEEIFRDSEDKRMLQLLVDGIENLDIIHQPFSTSWEEPAFVSASNIGLNMRALEVAYKMGLRVDASKLREIRKGFYDLFPYESKDRSCDLTLLFLCALDGILEDIDIDDILNNVAKELHGVNFLIRYKNDTFKPFDRNKDVNDPTQPCVNEPEWCMSAGYLAITYAKQGQIEIAKHYIDKLIELFPDGRIPESIEGCSGRKCLNSPLTWSCAITSVAIDYLNGKRI